MKRHYIRQLFFTLLAGVVVSGAAVALAAHTPPDIAQRGVASVIQDCLPAYVFVGGGSGAIISPDGYVITNAHVAHSSKRWRVRTADGTYHPARVVGISPATDLCLLKIDGGQDLPYLPLADSDQVRIGDRVIAIGNPFALGNIDGQPTVTLGVISGVNIPRPFAFDAIQTDAPINPGNSGGPLINLRGEMVGVNAQIQTRFGLRQNTGVGYAISANQVKRFLPMLKAAGGGQVPIGRIEGLLLPAELDSPAEVETVRPNTPAAEAGLQAGDVIVSMDNAPIVDMRSYQIALGRYPVGMEVKVTVRRGEHEELHTAHIVTTPHGQAYIGIEFELRSRTSLVIQTVDEGSPAEAAGVKPGDQLIGFQFGARGVRLQSRRNYYQLLQRMNPGIRGRIIVRRGDQNQALDLIVGERER